MKSAPGTAVPLAQQAARAGATIRREDEVVEPRPHLPAAPEAAIGADELHAFWAAMHGFYRTASGGGIGTTPAGAALYPAALAPLRDMTGLRYAYPVWVAEPGDTPPDPLVRPLSALLEEAAAAHAPAASKARMLKDNLGRLEDRLRRQLDGSSAAHPLRPAVEAAARAMLEELAIPGEEGNALEIDVAGLLEKLPAGGHLLGHSPATPVLLLEACLDALHAVRQRTFRAEAATLRARLRDLLEVEEAKSPSERRTEELVSGLGEPGELVDPEAYSRILPRRSASETLSPGRLERIRCAEAALLAFAEELGRSPGLRLRPEGVDVGAPEREGAAPWVRLHDAGSGAELTDVFEEHMAAMARGFAAARVARLEIEGAYDEAIHDDYFASFDWRHFTHDELALAAPVVLVDDEERLAHAGLRDLSRLLRSGRPVKVLLLHRRPEPGAGERASGEGPDPGTNGPDFRTLPEIAHLAVAYPEAFVLQSSTADPHHLAAGFRRGLESPRPAVFRVWTPAPGPSASAPAHPFVTAGAARDSRDFPLFVFDPDAAETWGGRFCLDGNPQPEQDWPRYTLEILDEHGAAGTLAEAFTCADFAALHPRLHDQLRPAPRPFWNDAMVGLADYLALDPQVGAAKVPYIWMVDGENTLQRVVPAHALVLLSQEQLGRWRVLQELGGVRNTHAERAAKTAAAAAKQQAERAMEALRTEHAAELERVRRETAGEAMAKLSRALLDVDLDAMAASVTRAAGAPPGAPAAGRAQAATAAEPAGAVEEEPVVSDEPWIETFRCTSCNECTQLNPLLFQYNADKLAFIADPRAGTYAELVAAAEKCPARCIHPGKPLNPDEPNLEALRKRAEKFQ